MPQKKNPDCFELIRGKTGRVVGNLTNLLITIKGLPLTYNRDLQEDKPPVFDSFDQLGICLAVTAGALKAAEIDEERCLEAASDPLLLATDLADYLVERKIPFRQAHHRVGSLVARSEELGVLLPDLSDQDALEVCPELGEDWRDVFNLDRAFAKREKPGMPGPAQISERIVFWESILKS